MQPFCIRGEAGWCDLNHTTCMTFEFADLPQRSLQYSQLVKEMAANLKFIALREEARPHSVAGIHS